MATVVPMDLDVSPRGERAGLCSRFWDDKTLLLSRAQGNNADDSPAAISADRLTSCIWFFMIPRVGETLRVMGRATITVEPTLMERFCGRRENSRNGVAG